MIAWDYLLTGVRSIGTFEREPVLLLFLAIITRIGLMCAWHSRKMAISRAKLSKHG